MDGLPGELVEAGGRAEGAGPAHARRAVQPEADDAVGDAEGPRVAGVRRAEERHGRDVEGAGEVEGGRVVRDHDVRLRDERDQPAEVGPADGVDVGTRRAGHDLGRVVGLGSRAGEDARGAGRVEAVEEVGRGGGGPGLARPAAEREDGDARAVALAAKSSSDGARSKRIGTVGSTRTPIASRRERFRWTAWTSRAGCGWRRW